VVLAIGGGRTVSVWVLASEVVGGVTIVMFLRRSRLFWIVSNCREHQLGFLDGLVDLKIDQVNRW
jgi:hypothetical protein